MAEPIAVVCADTHLDHLIWRTSPNITGDSFFAYEQIVDEAIRRKLPLIMAGDITELLPDNTPDSNTIAVHIEQASRLRNAGCPVVAVRGQHDRVRQGSKDWLQVVGLVDYGEPLRYTDVGGYKVAMLSWQYRTSLKDMLSVIDTDVAVTVCHQVWQQLMGGSGSEGSLIDVPGDLVISGDLHLNKLIKLRGGDKPKRAYSPGATHMRRRNEPDEHYVSLLRSDLTVSKIPLASRKVFRLQVEAQQTFDDLYKRLPDIQKVIRSKEYREKYPEAIRKPFLFVRDFSQIGSSFARLQDWCGDEFHLFYEALSVEDDVDLFRGDAVAPATLMDYVVEEVGNDPELLDFASTVLKADSPTKALQNYRDTVLAKGGIADAS